MRSRAIMLGWMFLLAPAAEVEATTPQPAPEVVPGVQGTWNLRWWSVAGRTYFIQASEDLVEWHFAPVIESGIDDWIEYETGSTAARHFIRLWYTDQPTNDPEHADFDNDGVSNIDELLNLMTHPFDWDSDDDGSLDGQEALAGNDPNDPSSGGVAVKGSIESSWTSLRLHEEFVFTGGNAALMRLPEVDDFEGGDWTEQQAAFANFTGATSFGEIATAAAEYPLPTFWEDAVRGLWWKNIKEDRSETETPDYFRDWTAGRIKHRMKLNRPAPKQGYKHPFQVLKLHWQRAEAEGSPWTPDAGNLAIIQDFEFERDETLSNELEYDPILTLAENKAVTLHAIRFEEVGPETGFDDHVRYLPVLRFERPWLAVANSTTVSTPPNAQVKLHFSPADQPLQLEVEVDGGHSATVSPNVISGESPVTLTIEGSVNFAVDENSYEGVLKIEGVPALQLAFYRRRVVPLAVHEISLINDDVEVEYPTLPGQPSKTVGVGEGKPYTVCVRKVGSVFDTTTPGNDDYIPPYSNTVTTGPNGLCETERLNDDDQIILFNEDKPQGEEDAAIITAGANGELNTPQNELASNIEFQGGTIEPQDDKISGSSITTGKDGIRQTPELTPRIDPVNVPTQQELKDTLDRVFGRQANIWFDIVEWNQADVGFDVGSTLAGDVDYPEMAKPNYFFDCYHNQEDSAEVPLVSREESLVQAASINSDPGTLNLYFIPTLIQVNRLIQTTPSVVTVEGWARTRLRTPYVSAFNPRHPMGEQLSSAMLCNAAAHELAHNDLLGGINTETGGIEHPWAPAENHLNQEGRENGLIPFKPDVSHTLIDQQTDRLRLMWYLTPAVNNPGTNHLPSMLLKHEADRLQETNLPPAP